MGKTGIVEGFAQLLVEGKLPDALDRPAVRRVDISARQANGWRKKSGLRRRTFAFHWHVGETTTLLEAGSASGSMDAANILKPALARGAIRVIGATTIREYRQTIEKDGALERRFQAVRIEEPSADEAVAILLALRPRLEAHQVVALEGDLGKLMKEFNKRLDTASPRPARSSPRRWVRRCRVPICGWC